MVEKKQTDWEKQEKTAKEGKESGKQKKKKQRRTSCLFPDCKNEAIVVAVTP